jgi:catechol 2,3-dioxygenase-like lactoylglutathione lyase family enzyme
MADASYRLVRNDPRAAGVKHYGNFRREQPEKINRLCGGRGAYFDDPDGHLLELMTRPYGATPEG